MKRLLLIVGLLGLLGNSSLVEAKKKKSEEADQGWTIEGLLKEGTYENNEGKFKDKLFIKRVQGSQGSYFGLLSLNKDETIYIYLIEPLNTMMKYSMTRLGTSSDGAIQMAETVPSLFLVIGNSKKRKTQKEAYIQRLIAEELSELIQHIFWVSIKIQFPVLLYKEFYDIRENWQIVYIDNEKEAKANEPTEDILKKMINMQKKENQN